MYEQRPCSRRGKWRRTVEEIVQIDIIIELVLLCNCRCTEDVLHHCCEHKLPPDRLGQSAAEHVERRPQSFT